MNWAALRGAIGAWADRLSLPERFILPLFTLQWGCGTVEKPDFTHLEFSTGHGQHDGSLYYNGIVFIRVMAVSILLPFQIAAVAALTHFYGWSNWYCLMLLGFAGLHVRWSGDPASKRQFMQVHIGWKKNGDFAPTLRFQTDASAAAGTYGHNYGQAQGWACGPH